MSLSLSYICLFLPVLPSPNTKHLSSQWAHHCMKPNQWTSEPHCHHLHTPIPQTHTQSSFWPPNVQKWPIHFQNHFLSRMYVHVCLCVCICVCWFVCMCMRDTAHSCGGTMDAPSMGFILELLSLFQRGVIMSRPSLHSFTFTHSLSFSVFMSRPLFQDCQGSQMSYHQPLAFNGHYLICFQCFRSLSVWWSKRFWSKSEVFALQMCTCCFSTNAAIKSLRASLFVVVNKAWKTVSFGC